jgi:hypothetical protein
LVTLILILLMVPLALSNHVAATASGGLFLVFIFFFPGYLLLGGTNALSQGLRLAISPVFGVVFLTTAYDVFVRASVGEYFSYCIAVLSTAGLALFVVHVRRNPPSWNIAGYRTIVAGGLVVLSVAPLYWRSGRFSGSEFVFYGPAGQDPLFHVTLVQRLLHRVPPDNVIVSGVQPSVYHYFDDLAVAMTLRAQPALHVGSVDLFDLYYRCYPTLFYFLLGALAYLVGRKLVGTTKGGILSILLLIGAGGLGWIIGILQTAVHAVHSVAMRERLFSAWTAWDGVDGIHPLVHRPANSHGLLVCLAALCILLPPERTRRHWLVAGLLLGLTAGFNFTLIATLGVAAVLGSVLFFLQRRKEEASHLAWLALWIFIGSLPVNAAMLLSGFHNAAPGFPFSGPNLEFPTSIWGMWLSRIVPAGLVPLACLVMFLILAYGLKLFGVGALARIDLGEERHRAVAMLFALAFAVNFMVGTFFPYQGVGVGVIFLQPTLWMLGLFALRPISRWLERNRGNWRAAILWGVLGLTWAQALLAFNFSFKTSLGEETVSALQDLRSTASPEDVIAYLPGDITQKAVWGYTQTSTNFAIMAMTGLDGYFSSRNYSTFSAAPGLSGSSAEEVLAKANRLYEQRHADIESFLRGDTTPAVLARLTQDHVRWIAVFGDAMQAISSPATPWRKTQEITIYRLSP